MPEIWFPYGQVETLFTIQVENLGGVVDPVEEKTTAEVDRLAERFKRSSAVFVCDSRPATAQLLKEIAGAPGGSEWPKMIATDPRRIESMVPELKGKVGAATFTAADGERAAFSPELLVSGTKVFLGTAAPDPLFGLSTPKVQACLSWIVNSRRLLTSRMSSLEPRVFEKTEAFDEAEGLCEHMGDASYVTVIPRGGKVRSVLEDAPFDAIKNGFFDSSLPQTKALVLGTGGTGYDDTLSAALKGAWSSVRCLRKSGALLLLAECTNGLGSKALEMLVTGVIGADTRRRERYVEGLEDLAYLTKLEEDYDVILMSGLPELYAKTKLGFTPARGSGEALGKLLNKAGRSSKVNVVTRASECNVVSA